MQRHEQVIQLSDHVKNKIKQHHNQPSMLSASSPCINSSDEFVEVSSTDDDMDSTRMTPDDIPRVRRDTFTTYRVKQSSSSRGFFTDKKSHKNLSVPILEEKYKKQKECQDCIHREHIIQYERERLLRLYDENKRLNEKLHSSHLLNQQYKDDIQKLKYHLTKVNSHLYEYQINFDQLKQKIVSEKKTSPKIDENKQQQEEDNNNNDEQDTTSDHLKRLRYEVQMYNRLVAAKQQQEQKTEQNQIDYLF